MPSVPAAQTRRVVAAVRPVPGEVTAEFHELLEKLPAAAYTCNADGLLTYCNAQATRLWGRTARLNDPAERYGGAFKLFDKDRVPLPPEASCMALALREGRPYAGEELIIEQPDGRQCTVLAHATPIRDKNGRLIGAVNMLVDITERRRIDAALLEAGRAKDDFLATLAHELRNPLAPVRSALHILRLSGTQSHAGRAALDIADRQMTQMVRLVEDLLDVSRITRNKLQLRRTTVQLQEVLQLALESSAPAIEAGGQELVTDIATEPVYLDVDPARIAQVVCNLLDNAAKFTHPDGRILLGARVEVKEVVITVTDTGIGITAEALPHVFDMFGQGEARPPHAHGLGVGLSLVKRLVEMHGGVVRAESPGLNLGSTFTLRLPCAASPERAVRQAPAGVVQNRAAGRRVLVVDDNRDAADTLRMLLDMLGNETEVAYDGETALEVADAFLPEVVLLDIGLPGADGYAVARALRRRAWPRSPLLVATTGWGQAADKERARDAGFDHHLVKPVDPDVLARLLAQERPH